MKFKMGVFKITNTSNNRIFVGSSQDLKAIWHAQKLQLDMGIHPNSGLQKDWTELGPENFSYEIIDEIKQDKDEPFDYSREIKALEELIIQELQPYEKNGYNRRS